MAVVVAPARPVSILHEASRGAWRVVWCYALALPIAAGMALLAPALLWFVAPRHPNAPPRR